MQEIINSAYYDTLYANPSYMTITRTIVKDNNNYYFSQKSFENLKNNKTKGIISSSAKKNIARAIDWMYVSSTEKQYKENRQTEAIKYRLTFITLTLPAKQLHSDVYIKKKLLNNFLVWLNKCENCNNYVWRAEKQLNGNLHFHIITDKFIYWYRIRTEWNKLCLSENYTQRYQQQQLTRFKNGFVYDPIIDNNCGIETAKRRYDHGQRTNWLDPNSTDIKPISNIKSCKAYISKYMNKNAFDDQLKRISTLKVKNEKFIVENGKNNESIINEISSLEEEIKTIRKNSEVIGRLWFVCRKFSKLKNFVIENIDCFYKDLSKIYKKLGEKVMTSDFFDCIRISYYDLKRLKLFDLYRWFTAELNIKFKTTELCVKN